jgi:hypothetical protein
MCLHQDCERFTDLTAYCTILFLEGLPYEARDEDSIT